MLKDLIQVCVIAMSFLSCSTSYLNKYHPNRQEALNEPSNKGSLKIYPISDGAFRFKLPYTSVWNSLLDTLIGNYNFAIVDKNSGIITTEWDSFYLRDKILRNKLSVRLKRVSYNVVDVFFHNSVETLSNPGGGGISSEWLPYEEGREEIGRIVLSIATILRQQEPILPPDMVARSTTKSKNRR